MIKPPRERTSEAVFGERVRLAEHIANLRALIDGLESTARAHVPCSYEAQAVADSAIRLVTSAAKLDAYQRADAVAEKGGKR